MGPGPALASIVLAAHRTRSAGVVTAQRWTLHLRRDRVIGVEGVPDLLADLRRPSSGDLVADLQRFTRAGVPYRRVTDAACSGVRRALVQLIRGPGTAEWLPGAPPPPTALELPVGLLRLFTQALAEARDPETVEADFRPVMKAMLIVDLEAGREYALDTIARRVLVQAVACGTLDELIMVSGRGQLNRTRHAWRAFDLLYHLGLLRLNLMQPLRSADCEAEPIRLEREAVTDRLEEVDEDEIDTEQLPELELEWVSQEPVVEDEVPSESPGFWQGGREVVEVPLNVYTLRRMALEFTWANPLEVVGVPPWEPAVPCNIENAYARRQSEFAAERFDGDPDALEAAATCRRLVQAAYELLADEASRQRWDADRQG